MESSISAMIFLFCNILLFSMSWAASTAPNPRLLRCLSISSTPAIPVYTQNNSSYNSILQSNIQVLRFATPKTPKPQLIITPLRESHVQIAVACCRKYGLQIRVRSGGHDLEGLSYVSHVPFVVLDLIKLQYINVDVQGGTAWVQAGATIAQVSYKIAEKSSTYGFVAGTCPSMGVGGHISGGGYGNLMRKYGLSADNIVDARIVNADGKILNRNSMGEDLFWAIRGGGGASFGVIVSWKIKLVPVPPIVTVFRVHKTVEEGVTPLVYKWQYVAHEFPKELSIRLGIRKWDSIQPGKKTVFVSFTGLFLGRMEQVLSIMNQSFPELNVKREDCQEVSWIQSIPYFVGLPLNSSMDVVARNQLRTFYKGKSDYVQEPISIAGLEGLWKLILETNDTGIAFIPYGGRMSEIPDSETPFPHRAGNIYHIGYFVYWKEEGAAKKSIDWIRRVYKYMTPYVSKSPRRAYLNYRDLDLGQNKNGNASYAKAKIWGRRYFNNNFDRLVRVKSKVDPDNFFKNEQSIPVVPSMLTV